MHKDAPIHRFHQPERFPHDEFVVMELANKFVRRSPLHQLNDSLDPADGPHVDCGSALPQHAFLPKAVAMLITSLTMSIPFPENGVKYCSVV